MKYIKTALIFGFIFIFATSFFAEALSEENNNIRASCLRLHILANSDSEDDQELKIFVRNAIIQYAPELFCNVDGLSDAEKIAEEKLSDIIKIAEKEIRERGYSYSVRAYIGKKFFSTRDYGDFTFPAGQYDAVTVEIGSGEGKNWWCVLFPPLCLTDGVISEKEKDVLTENGFTDEDIDIITGKTPKYVMKFKVVEIWERIKEFLCFK